MGYWAERFKPFIKIQGRIKPTTLEFYNEIFSNFYCSDIGRLKTLIELVNLIDFNQLTISAIQHEKINQIN